MQFFSKKLKDTYDFDEILKRNLTLNLESINETFFALICSKQYMHVTFLCQDEEGYILVNMNKNFY